MYRIRFFCWSVNQKNFLLRCRFSKWNRHSYILEKLLLQKDKKIISFWENINHFKKIQFLYTGWNPFVSESIRRIHFCEINLSNENKMLIHCKDSFCRRIRQWFPSAKILIVRKNCFLYPSGDMWIRRIFFCEISLSKWKTNEITLKKISVEIWIIRMFFLIMYRMKSFCRRVNKKNFLLSNGSFKIKTKCW